MFFHYLKLSGKALLKNKYYTLINVGGLFCGMLSALIIAKYISGSMQFDSFHENRDKIYSLIQQESIGGNPQQISLETYWGTGELARLYPEVARVTRYSYHISSLVSSNANGKVISNMEDNIFIADSSFLKVFTFPLIAGNAANALSEFNSVVLTKAASKFYFGDSNAIGKSISIRAPWGEQTSYQVTGVIDDIPKKSRFGFRLLISQRPLSENDYWALPGYSTYMLLNNRARADDLAAKLTSVVNDQPQLKSGKRKQNIALESVGNVHLSTTEYLLIAVGVFIVLISWVNYINQVIAQSYWRTKEIAVLRVTGASMVNLKMQFLVESAIVCVTALFLIVVSYRIIEPSLQSFANGHLAPLFGDPTGTDYLFLAIFGVGLILVTVTPTTILLSQDFGASLRNAAWSKIGNIGLRRALVIVQFSISTVLIICVLVINGQLDYMRTQDKGIDLANVIVVKAPILPDSGVFMRRSAALALFKEKCSELPFVSEVASSTAVPGEGYRHETYISIDGQVDKYMVHQIGIDEHYLDLYDAKFIAGHGFIPNANSKNKSDLILNLSAARNLGIHDYEKAINSKIVDRETDAVYLLIGIVNDFHQTSLKYIMRPMAFKFDVSRGNISLKLNKQSTDDDRSEGIAAIRNNWQSVYHDAFFDSFYLSEKFDMQDGEDLSFGILFRYFTFLAILISCLGLFSLSLMLSVRRQKEIGIRKVFGASQSDLLTVLAKSYLGPLAISLLIGSPVAYWLMSTWLTNYAYRIEIGLGIFVSAVASLIFIFVFTVAYSTMRSLKSNPVKILKS